MTRFLIALLIALPVLAQDEGTAPLRPLPVGDVLSETFPTH